jgi:putative membrane protein
MIVPSELDTRSSPSKESGFRFPRTVGDRPGIWAALVSALIYLTLGILLLVPRGAPPAPALGPPLSVLTAVANALTFLFLTTGWLSIRAGNRLRHRALMELAFLSIVSFLALYVTRQILSGTLAFGGPEGLYLGVYLPLLLVHLAISTATVPPVIYNFLVGLSRPLNRVGATLHPRVGRIIVPLWMASSLMGLTVFALLRLFPAG